MNHIDEKLNKTILVDSILFPLKRLYTKEYAISWYVNSMVFVKKAKLGLLIINLCLMRAFFLTYKSRM